MFKARRWFSGTHALAWLSAAAGLLLGACGDVTSSPAAGTFKSRTPGVLTVVTAEVPSPGFWEGTADHVTGGFEFELAKRIAERMGLKTVRVEIEKFHRIVEGQLDGADLALDLITPTNERMHALTFSTPYLDAAPTVLVRSGTAVPDLETARGLRWGAVHATTLVGITNTMIRPHTPLRIYESTSDMVLGLEDRQVDAVLLDLPLAVETAHRSGGRLDAAAQLPAPELIAAALPKGSGNEQAVDSAIRAFTNDGTIDHLLRLWIGSKAGDAEKSLPLLETTL